MDEPVCDVPGCGAPSPSYLCRHHKLRLRAALRQLPELLAEIEVTTTRQSVTSSGGGAATKASEEPIAFDIDASDMGWVVRNTVTTWARVIADELYGRLGSPSAGPVCVACFHPSCSDIRTRAELRRKAIPPARFAALCGWIAHHLSWVVQQRWAGQLYDEITSIRPFANRTVDNREDRYAGPCTATVVAVSAQLGEFVTFEVSEPRTCGADLRMRNGAQLIWCRECGAEYDAENRQDWISKQAGEQVATAALIAAALAETKVKIKATTIRKWAERTRLHQAQLDRWHPPMAANLLPAPEPWPIPVVACRVRDRAPLYRVADVYERAVGTMARLDLEDRITA